MSRLTTLFLRVVLLFSFFSNHYAAFAKRAQGLVGFGITLYGNKACPYSCMVGTYYNRLNCSYTPEEVAAKGLETWESTPPECYASDEAYLTTIALCYNEFCKGLSFVEKTELYQTLTVGWGEEGESTLEPKMSYEMALMSIKYPVDDIMEEDGNLTRTARTPADLIEKYMNAYLAYEDAEVGNSRYA